MKQYLQILFACNLLVLLSSCGPRWSETDKGDYNIVDNKGGKTLGYSSHSGVTLLEKNGYAFKDLNKNGEIDKYEDWRLSNDQRAKDLAHQLTIEEIAGLMLYSSHQSIPSRPRGYFAGTYNGKPYTEGETEPSDLTDQQMKFLKEDNLRHILLTSVKTPVIAAQWSNKTQAFCESIGKGIPANNSSDPRHGTTARAVYDAAAGGQISMWPSSIGMAATFNPNLVKEFGQTAASEYRALGITTALSPQVDIATDPRWMRFKGTFGESPKLAAAMAKAYCDGFQSDEWGMKSVNAMVKHWPGGGSGEGGRDAHYGIGKYAVYPGNNFDDHLVPFLEGAFDLDGETQMASAVMPYYTISWNQDQNSEQVGNTFSRYLITDLLRNKYGYDGVVCTDWGATRDHTAMDAFIDGKPWGIEELSIVDRHYKVLMVGADQFGGNNDAKPIIAAYEKGVKELGEDKMRARMEQSAVRLLRNIFRTGLFENPYLDLEKTKSIVGHSDKMTAGYEAQLQSIVLVKNQHKTLPLKDKKKVYVPKRYTPASRNFLGMETAASMDFPVSMDLVKKYYTVTENPDQADFAIVFIQNPEATIGYDKADLAKGGNGYSPISLQYRDYTATDARDVSIAGGDPLETFANRTYKNKTTKTANITDMQLVLDTKTKMGDKPVIVSVTTTKPLVFNEFEAAASAILVNFGVQDQAVFDLIAGKAEPSALLPMQMPINMSTVEKQFEDVPFDMVVHKDSDGNKYDFGFGMNWNGVITDERVGKYEK
ncbi:MAG TPA: beta-glucosidase [Flavobacteriaceae bacterium]|nr:beta-glucosidase [Flavobacteriaceae bacterium]